LQGIFLMPPQLPSLFQSGELALLSMIVSVVVAVMFLVTSAVRLYDSLIHLADSTERLQRVNGTILGAFIWTLERPGHALRILSSQGGVLGALFHPFGAFLLLGSALLAWQLGLRSSLSAQPWVASGVLATGLLGFAGATTVVTLTASDQLQQ